MQTRPHYPFPLPPLAIDILLALLCATGFSAFIYFEHFGLTFKLINSVAALIALYGMLVISKRAVLFTGFFIGLFWFYWIGFSFRFYDLSWMVPLVSLGFGVVYLLYFGVMALSDSPWVRGLLLLCIGYLIEPFGFNWMQLPLPFVESYFGTDWWQFSLIVIVLSMIASIKEKGRFALPLLLLLALDFGSDPKAMPPLKIKLVATDVAQDEKWTPRMRDVMKESNIVEIDKAIREGYELVVLPESVFALYMNHDEELQQRLKRRSYKIAIVAGTLYEEEGKNYNVTYFFQNGEVTVAKKMFLVPFGEYIPLPGFAREFINELFFDGASDYASSDHPTDFLIKETRFRNAICYEATCEPLYEDAPRYMIAISNNAWFMPSIEPTLQELLIRYYARRHGTIVFHATNRSGTCIVE